VCYGGLCFEIIREMEVVLAYCNRTVLAYKPGLVDNVWVKMDIVYVR